jgi:hypothetical protein
VPSRKLFGKLLVELGGFVSLEENFERTSRLPRESDRGRDMDECLTKAYADLDDRIKEALKNQAQFRSLRCRELGAGAIV